MIYNSKKVETIQMSINCLVDKQKVIWVYGGILLSHTEWGTGRCYNINKFWKHAVWKNQPTEEHILYDSTYLSCLE